MIRLSNSNQINYVKLHLIKKNQKKLWLYENNKQNMKK